MSTPQCPHCQAPLTDAQATMCAPCRALFHPEPVKRPLPQAGPPPSYIPPASGVAPQATRRDVPPVVMPPTGTTAASSVARSIVIGVLIVVGYFALRIGLRVGIRWLTHLNTSTPAVASTASASQLLDAEAAEIRRVAERADRQMLYRLTYLEMEDDHLQVDLQQKHNPLDEDISPAAQELYLQIRHITAQRVPVCVDVYYHDPDSDEPQHVGTNNEYAFNANGETELQIVPCHHLDPSSEL